MGFVRSFDITPTKSSRLSHETSLLTSPFTPEDHVLRSSASSWGHNSTRSARPRSSSIVTNPWEEDERPSTDDHILRNKSRNKSNHGSKYSPTPSIKRGKAEKLLKEHASPPGVRVTAGGRIVPDGLGGISIPRFDPADLTRDQNHASSRGNPGSSGNSLLRPLNGMLVDIGSGNLCQVVDCELKPVYAHNGQLRLYMPVMNPVVQPAPVAHSPLASPMYPPPYAFPGNVEMGGGPSYLEQPNPSNGLYAQIPSDREVAIMEQFQKNLENELRALDRDEVLHKNELSSNARAEIAKKRVELTLRIDECRKGVIAARQKRDVANSDQSQRLPPAHPGHPVLPYLVGQPWAMPMLSPYGNGPSQQYLAYPEQLAQDHFAGMHSSPSATEYQHGAGRVVPLPYNQHSVENSAPQTQDPPGYISYTELPVSQAPGLEIAVGPLAKGVKSMNLDGSTNQGRRSHAIQIKNPNEQSSKARSSLNPASPTYQPTGPHVKSPVSEHRTDDGTFIPSPRLVAKIDQMVQSPEQAIRNLADGSDENAPPQGSSSSATTGDFFPHDTHHYSSTKYSFQHDSGVNFPAWMGADNSTALGPTTTPVRGAKTLPRNDSPNDGVFHTAPNTDERSNGAQGSTRRTSHGIERHPAKDDCDIDFIEQSSFRRISPATQKQQSAHLDYSASAEIMQSPQHDMSPTTEQLLREIERAVSQKEKTSPNKSPLKSDSYLKGYSLGIKQEIMRGDQDDDYCRGYRDGIVYASNRNNSDSNSARSQCRTTTLQVDTELANRGPGLPALYRAASLPLFNLPNEPARTSCAYPENVPSSARHGSPLAPPSGGSEMRVFSADAAPSRQIGTQTSNFQLRSPDPPSPLANRYSGNQMRQLGAGKAPSYSGRVPSMHAFDQQRFNKASTSVAPSNNYARGRFQQIDGSADDDVSHDSTPKAKTPASPPAKTKGNSSPRPSGSPVKQKASAALARIEQLAGMSKRAKSTTDNAADDGKTLAEKEKRRIKWAKRFDTIKHNEQKEIEVYKSKNPSAAPSPRK